MRGHQRIELAEVIGSYFGVYLQGEKGLSRNTRKSYFFSVELYLRWLRDTRGKSIDELDPEDLTGQSAKEFLRHLEEDRDCCVRTRNQRLSGLKNFFGYLAYERPDLVLESARLKDIRGKRGPKGLIDWLDEKEMEVLLAAIEGDGAGTIRDKAMFTLGYALGLRVSEITGLTLDRIFLGSDPQILIHGKGGTRDPMPLPDDCVTVLENWLAVRRPNGEVARVFLNRIGKPITRAGVADRLAKYVKIAEARCASITRKTVSPHVLRHSCAMRILHQQHDPRVVARFLRHRDFGSVEIYLHASSREKKRLMFELGDTGIKPGSFAKRSTGVLAALERAKRDLYGSPDGAET